MTGAVSCLAGIDDIGIVIHGASGCYFFPATVLHREIHCSFLVEEDIIFGAGNRLRETVAGLSKKYRTVAVVNTCTPALIGEEIGSLPREPHVIMVDAPGFTGTYEEGYLKGAAALPLRIDREAVGVTVDGMSPLDPFYSGNRLEAVRLLSLCGIRDPVLFPACPYGSLSAIPESIISTNPDLSLGLGVSRGTFLGISSTVEAILSLDHSSREYAPDPVLREAAAAEEEISRVCDKFLQRHDPPSIAVFGGEAYARFAAGLLEQALDASITCIGCRSPPADRDRLPTEDASTLGKVRDLIGRDPPDLILGSSFEQSLAPSAAFVPFTFPLRGRVRLRPRALVGIQGTLGLIEDVLNACLDRGSTLTGSLPA